MRATEHAPCDPFRVREHRDGLALIIERGGVVLVERRRVKWAAAKGRPPELTWESVTSPGARAIGRGLEAWTNLALTARIMGVCIQFIPAADDFGGLRGWDVLESAARDWSAQWADREKAARFVAEASRLASVEKERNAKFLRDLDALGVGPG